MKIAYVTIGNPYNKNSWSGTDYYCRKALEDAGNDVYCIQVPHSQKYNGLLKKIYSKAIGRNYIHERSISFLKNRARYIEGKIQHDTDAIFCIGSIFAAYIKTNIPIYYYTDGVFSLSYQQYAWCQSMPDFLINEQQKIEEEALRNCTKAFVSSECIKPEMISKYHGDAKKIEIVPFGANIDVAPNANEVQNSIHERSKAPDMKVLFVGVEWLRKGGGF